MHVRTIMLAMMFTSACTSSKNSSDDVTPTPTPDVGAPAVVSVDPLDGAVDVIRNARAQIVFDGALSAESVTTSTFSLSASGSAIDGSVSYDPSAFRALFTPTDAMPSESVVTATVTTGIRSAHGISMTTDFAWSFTTGTTSDTTAPTFSGISDANDNGDGTATLLYDAASDDYTDVGAIIYTLYLDSDLTSALKTVTGTTTLVTDPMAPGSYTFAVRATDSAGNEDTNAATASVDITVPTVSFAADVQPIFTASCTANQCHDSTQPQAGLNLTEGNAYDEIIGVMSDQVATYSLIQPGDEMNSYLYLKLINDPATTGNQMPSGSGTPLSPGELAIVRNWILGGALEN